jgi:hypothetical protein
MKPAEIYILNQPELYRDILLNLQIIIENTIPGLTLEYKWKIPYYYYKGKPFCFLNASHKNKYVDIGINKGYQLKNNLDVLIGDKRTIFKSLRYFSLDDIDAKILKEVILESVKLYK